MAAVFLNSSFFSTVSSYSPAEQANNIINNPSSPPLEKPDYSDIKITAEEDTSIDPTLDSSITGDGGISNTEKKKPKYEKIFPIHVKNNWSDYVKLKIVKGKGTENNPYVLENYEINASEGYYGIKIEDSKDVYFVISNCLIYMAAYNDSHYEFETREPIKKFPRDAGIVIQNSENGIIQDCNITANYGNAINLIASRKIVVINNVMENNRFAAVFLYGANNNELLFNNINTNEEGIYSRNSRDNVIYNNLMEYNFKSGVRVKSSTNSTFKNNIIKYSADSYYFFQSNKIKFDNNTAEGSTFGLTMLDSLNINISNSKFLKNAKHGSYFLVSKKIKIETSTFNDNGKDGIFLSSCEEVKIINNTKSFDNNGEHGIRLYRTNLSVVSGNVFRNNPVALILEATENNQIFQNTFIDNEESVQDIEGENNIVFDNQIIFLPSSDYSSVTVTTSTQRINSFSRAFGKKLSKRMMERMLERMEYKDALLALSEEPPSPDILTIIAQPEILIPIIIFSCFLLLMMGLNWTPINQALFSTSKPLEKRKLLFPPPLDKKKEKVWEFLLTSKMRKLERLISFSFPFEGYMVIIMLFFFAYVYSKFTAAIAGAWKIVLALHVAHPFLYPLLFCSLMFYCYAKTIFGKNRIHDVFNIR
ncbi:MAG: right-handed parallel beta-helix repeat-containing protein, partial [Candidatus Helarchaeota archaeon]